jgi:hypothetical protein
MAPPFLYALAMAVWQGPTCGNDLMLDIRFPGAFRLCGALTGFESCPRAVISSFPVWKSGVWSARQIRIDEHLYSEDYQQNRL